MVFWVILSLVALLGLFAFAVAVGRHLRRRDELAGYYDELHRAATIPPPPMPEGERATDSDFPQWYLPPTEAELTYVDRVPVPETGERLPHPLDFASALPRNSQVPELLAPNLPDVAITAITAPEGADNDNGVQPEKERA